METRRDRIAAAVGGNRHRIGYQNGDRREEVSTVSGATVVGAVPVPGGGEIVEFGWFEPAKPPKPKLNQFANVLLADLGYLQ
ncbi:MAG: hypothetical protein ACRENX_09890 [Candidatus Dormibacteria bacterium]